MSFSWEYLFLSFLGMLTITTAQYASGASLNRDLFSYYDKDLPPSYGESTTVDMSLSLEKLNKLDFYKGTIQMTVTLKMMWKDFRLRWDPAQYGNISDILIPSSKLWIPEISLYNSNSPSEMLKGFSAHVYSYGSISYHPSMKIEADCSLDLKDYPNDTQTCQLVYGYGMFDTSRISLRSTSDTMHLDEYRENPLWEPFNTSAVKHTREFVCCEEVYDDITYSLTVRRREGHGRIVSAVGMDDGMHGSMHPSYSVNRGGGGGGRVHASNQAEDKSSAFWVTSMITTWLILTVFLVGPSSAGIRIIFGGFIIVALVVLSVALNAQVDNFPETKLGRFLMGGMTVTAVVIIINGLVHRCYPKEHPVNLNDGERSKSKKLRIFVFIDIVAFLITVIILGTLTGLIFAY
eukprot:XP_003723410.1 PREDICTED: neuronal acetylcholine receptor subunit alpha-2 [Strongylocentrotus purpuratus]